MVWKYFPCAAPGFKISNYNESAAYYLTEQRKTTLHPHPSFNITNVKPLAENWKFMCNFTQYNCTLFPTSVFYAI